MHAGARASYIFRRFAFEPPAKLVSAACVSVSPSSNLLRLFAAPMAEAAFAAYPAAAAALDRMLLVPPLLFEVNCSDIGVFLLDVL